MSSIIDDVGSIKKRMEEIKQEEKQELVKTDPTPPAQQQVAAPVWSTGMKGNAGLGWLSKSQQRGNWDIPVNGASADMIIMDDPHADEELPTFYFPVTYIMPPEWRDLKLKILGVISNAKDKDYQGTAIANPSACS